MYKSLIATSGSNSALNKVKSDKSDCRKYETNSLRMLKKSHSAIVTEVEILGSDKKKRGIWGRENNYND